MIQETQRGRTPESDPFGFRTVESATPAAGELPGERPHQDETLSRLHRQERPAKPFRIPSSRSDVEIGRFVLAFVAMPCASSSGSCPRSDRSIQLHPITAMTKHSELGPLLGPAQTFQSIAPAKTLRLSEGKGRSGRARRKSDHRMRRHVVNGQIALHDNWGRTCRLDISCSSLALACSR
jgi:hypothetical protein